MVTPPKASKPKKMSAQTLGEFVRQERKKHGLTLAELGKQLRVTPQFVYDIERGRRSPSPVVLERLAKALETPIRVLRALDTRSVLGELKQLAENSPALRFALGQALSEVRDSEISVEELAHRIANSR